MPKESFEAKKKRVAGMLALLKKHDPNPRIALKYSTPIQLLAAVQLSAQTTDIQVNKVTQAGPASPRSHQGGLFKKYKTVDDFANADVKTFQKEISSIGLYRNKGRNIIEAARMIRDDYGGKMPRTMEEMIKLPGVGRKSANVILGNAFGVVEGIAVDTHVMRLSQHFGWTKEKTPEKIEQDLMKLIPRKDWFIATYLIIDYGRTICTARKCQCDELFDWKGLHKH